ncbi:MAG: hypothetical protein QOJ55_2481, partial [Solirubrobacteraceae bacterium]|nr:hypothetical protein [Solirubrobacteraceae bacterium]
SAHMGQGMTLTIRSAVLATGEPSVHSRARARPVEWAGARRAAVGAAPAPPPAGATPAAANPPTTGDPAAVRPPVAPPARVPPRTLRTRAGVSATGRDAEVGVAAGVLETAGAGVGVGAGAAVAAAAAGTATGD